jgi:type III pantothenate kinase
MKGKLLAVDIGNSNIVTGIWQNNAWSEIWRFSSHPSFDDKDFYTHALHEILVEREIKTSEITDIVVSSVVPSLIPLWLNALKAHFKVEPILIGKQHFSTLKMGIIAQDEIGTDILSNAYAVFNRYPFDSIVIDFGTALTFTTVSKSSGII